MSDQSVNLLEAMKIPSGLAETGEYKIDPEHVKRRIRRPELLNKIMSAEAAANFIRDGMVIGMSGFTLAGDPKVIPHAFSEIAKGGKRKIFLMTGAALSPEVDSAMINANVIYKRMPFICDKITRKAINNGDVLYFDQNLSDPPLQIRNKQIPAPDIAVVEATAITEDGMIIPTTSFGNTGVPSGIAYISPVNFKFLKYSKNSKLNLFKLFKYSISSSVILKFLIYSIILSKPELIKYPPSNGFFLKNTSKYPILSLSPILKYV